MSVRDFFLFQHVLPVSRLSGRVGGHGLLRPLGEAVHQAEGGEERRLHQQGLSHALLLPKVGKTRIDVDTTLN